MATKPPPKTTDLALLLLDGKLHTKAELKHKLTFGVSPEHFIRLRIKTKNPNVPGNINWLFAKLTNSLVARKLVERLGYDGQPLTGRLASGVQYKLKLTEKGLKHYKNLRIWKKQPHVIPPATEPGLIAPEPAPPPPPPPSPPEPPPSAGPALTLDPPPTLTPPPPPHD